VKRRQFISLLGGAAAAWPLAAGAQQAMPLVVFLRSAPFSDPTHLVIAFRQGLKDAGWVEGKNVAVEYHSAENDHDRLTALVNDLVRRPVAVIVANVIAATAAKAATTTVPIVFTTGSDPVQDGLVTSFNRPGGVTGV
jgi:putative ABC transport system substrate-binding protein